MQPSSLGQLGEGLLDQICRILVVHQLAVIVGIVGCQVEVAVSGQGYEDGLGLTRLLAPARLVNCGLDGVSRLWSGDYAFAAGENGGCFENLVLLQCRGLDQTVMNKITEQRGIAVKRRPPAWMPGGMKSCPRVYILITGAMPAVLPKS